jgi:hypothetical protein
MPRRPWCRRITGLRPIALGERACPFTNFYDVAAVGHIGPISQFEVTTMNDSNTAERILTAVTKLYDRVGELESQLADMATSLPAISVDKRWYTTAEVAEAMRVSRYTVQERWYNRSRIDCSKDPQTGRWRIPVRELRRLLREGPPL